MQSEMYTLVLQRVTIGLAVVFSTFTASQSVDKQLHDLFDPQSQPFATAEALPSWSRLLDRIAEQDETIQQCLNDESMCEGRLQSVQHLLVRGRELDREQQVRLVNRYINRFSRYREDRRRDVSVGQSTVRVGQEWSTLTEFLQQGGDCEDYATSKYQLLRLFGVPAEELRVVVIYDRTEREHHAIVGIANVEGQVLLLDTDNQIYRRRPPMYRFVYALNEDHVWDYGVEDTRLKSSVRRALKERRLKDDATDQAP